ncbi:PGRP2 amidase, partial [Eolophus roseicapillus]|nr:PGRP2 amidase [Eolophus roseicapilla]
AGLPPRHMDSVVALTEALDSGNPNLTVPELARALGACSTPGCRAVLGEPPLVPLPPPALSHQQWVLLTQLLHRDAAVLAPDGSTVALGPLLAGIEVGQKRGSGWPFPTLDPPIDPLYAVTITEALATSFLLARGGDGATLGPAGCWDDVDDPQNYTLLGPPSPVPDAVANGAMDGVLLGTQAAQAPIPLAALLRGYYGTGNATEQGRPRSSYRRRAFGALLGPEALEREVEAMLRVLRVLAPTRELLQEVGPEEAAAMAHRAARDFTQLYVECPPIVPRCMWGARPYRGTPKALTLPLESVFIHHTLSPSAPCHSFRSCSSAMRSMQRFHQDTRGWDDIGY